MEKVLDYIRKNGMVQRGDRIIAGVSGGPDSVCLLFLLDKYKETLGISLEVVQWNMAFVEKKALRMRLLWKTSAGSLLSPVTLTTGTSLS